MIFCKGAIDTISENCVPFHGKFQCLGLFFNYNLRTSSDRLCLTLSFNGTITIPTQISNHNQKTIFHCAFYNGFKSTQIFCQNAQTIAIERLSGFRSPKENRKVATYPGHLATWDFRIWLCIHKAKRKWVVENFSLNKQTPVYWTASPALTKKR